MTCAVTPASQRPAGDDVMCSACAQAHNGVTHPAPGAGTITLHPLKTISVARQTVQLDMPPLKQPESLLVACQHALEREFLSGKCCYTRLQEIAEILPYPVAEDFLHNMLTTKNPDQDLSPLFTPKIKSLQLNRIKKSITDDAIDEQIGRLVENVEKCTNLQKLEISGSGSPERNSGVQVRALLLKMDFSKELQSIKLKNFGSALLLNNPEIARDFLQKLTNLEKLEELEVSEISMNETCLKNLLKLKKLVSLSLENSNLSSIQVLQILTGLPRLKFLGI